MNLIAPLAPQRLIVLEQQLAAATGLTQAGIPTTAFRHHDHDLTQSQPDLEPITAALIPDFVGVNTGGRLHVLFDGLVRRCQHGADQLFRLTDGASAETLAKVLLDLADALVKLATLQGDSA